MNEFTIKELKMKELDSSGDGKFSSSASWGKPLQLRTQSVWEESLFVDSTVRVRTGCSMVLEQAVILFNRRFHSMQRTS